MEFERKIKILHCLGWVTGGGVEQIRVLMANSLPKDRYEHVLICQVASGHLADQLRNSDWKIHEIGLAPSILDRAWHDKALKIARDFDPDIVHGAVYEGEALAASIGLRLPGIKVITEETSDPANRRWTGNLLMYAICMSANICIGVSPAVVSYLRHKLHLPKRKVRLVNNAVSEVPRPTSDMLTALRNEFGIKDGDFIIGSVGRVFDDCKRFSDLIRAMPAVLAQHPQARLMIVRDGPDCSMLEKLCVTLGVGNSVIFAGYRSDVRTFYPLMDIFALASAYEAFGLVLVEAMFADVPIIATEVGGIPFVLDSGRCGALVPPLAPLSLSRTLSDLIASPSLRAEYARLGLARAREEFSAERYCREIDELYTSLIQ